MEHGTAMIVLFLLEHLELEIHAVFLTPLYQFRLEVHLFVCHLIYIDKFAEDALLHEVHAGVVASVEIERAHESLEGVATHIAIVCRSVAIAQNELLNAHLVCQPSERFALYNLRSGIGEESFPLSREVAVDDIAHYGVENGVAEEFQSLIVHGLAFSILAGNALVHERQFIIANVSGIKTYNVIDRKIKLPILTEGELYPVDNITQHIS